jgi:N-acylglucosamine-6-phosphate 2-epimerase
MNPIVERLRGGLIVSVQAEADSLLNTPETIALFARCAVANGAVGVRVEGEARIAAVRAALPDVPIVGILKRVHEGFEPYITSTAAEVALVARAGASIVAFDATVRGRSDGSTVAGLVAHARAQGLVAMADCSDESDAAAAAAAGADLVGTTLAGYTAPTRGRPLPALDLLRSIARGGAFAVCEGGVATPGDLRAAFGDGADAVVVGTAITNLDVLVRRFAEAAPRRLP